jgi:hypothetical protein
MLCCARRYQLSQKTTIVDCVSNRPLRCNLPLFAEPWHHTTSLSHQEVYINHKPQASCAHLSAASPRMADQKNSAAIVRTRDQTQSTIISGSNESQGLSHALGDTNSAKRLALATYKVPLFAGPTGVVKFIGGTLEQFEVVLFLDLVWRYKRESKYSARWNS